MTRHDFLQRLTLTAAGLLVADDVLELLAPRRKYWSGADFGPPMTMEVFARHMQEEFAKELLRSFKRESILAHYFRVP